MYLRMQVAQAVPPTYRTMPLCTPAKSHTAAESCHTYSHSHHTFFLHIEAPPPCRPLDHCYHQFLHMHCVRPLHHRHFFKLWAMLYRGCLYMISGPSLVRHAFVGTHVLSDAVLRTTRPARDALPVSRTTRSTRLRSARLHAFHAPLGVTRKARARSPRPAWLTRRLL